MTDEPITEEEQAQMEVVSFIAGMMEETAHMMLGGALNVANTEEERETVEHNMAQLRVTIMVKGPSAGTFRSVGYSRDTQGIEEHADDIMQLLVARMSTLGARVEIVEVLPESMSPHFNDGQGPVMH